MRFATLRAVPEGYSELFSLSAGICILVEASALSLSLSLSLSLFCSMHCLTCNNAWASDQGQTRLRLASSHLTSPHLAVAYPINV